MIKPLTPTGRAVFAAVIVAGTGVYLGALAATMLRPDHGLPWGFLGLLLATLAASVIGVRIPGLNSVLSLSDTFIFVTILVYGPLPAVVIAGMDGFVSTRRHSGRLLSSFSSLALMSLSVLAAGCAYRFTLGFFADPAAGLPGLNRMLVPLGAMALVHYLANSFLVATLTALARRLPVLPTWKENYAWTALNFITGALVAGLLVTLVQELGLTAFLICLPILAATYLTYRVYLGRLEDKNRHIAAMNQVHHRALEILAKAIDARGQSTHGHLGRVQAYALGLADLVGLDDDTIEAIRSAVLLHDVGKLAIPDYVLNKPGPLTLAERNKMQTYPRIGAQMLEQVGFPYPVVPIIRHHRESWDGTGYPDGLAGERIPVGARILGLAEAVDAMLSPRAWRPAHSRADVLVHLEEEAGGCFDPHLARLFVDHFRQFERRVQGMVVEAPGSMEEIAAIQQEHAQSMYADEQVPGALENISAVREEALALFDLAKDLGLQATLKETLPLIMERVRSLIRFDTGAIFLVAKEGSLLIPAVIDGWSAETMQGMSLRRGEGITGWALDNLKIRINAQPEMDFFGSFLEVGRQFRSAAVVPLVTAGTCVGTLTLYDRREKHFSSEHERILELIAPQAAGAIEQARSLETARRGAMTDALTGLANSRFLFVQLQKELARARRTSRSFALGVFDLDRFKPVNDTYGHHVGDEVLHWLGQFLREQFRSSDTLCRWGGDEFVVLMPEASEEVVESKLRRLQREVEESDIPVSMRRPVRVGMSVGWAFYPEDGEEYEELIRVADKRMYRDKAARHDAEPDQRIAAR